MENKNDKGFSKLGDLFTPKNIAPKKPPTYKWQELALRIIEELGVPGFKRNSVFKICKDKDRILVEACLRDTKELVKSGEKWKYFFKLISSTDPSKASDPSSDSRFQKGIHKKAGQDRI